MSLSIDTNLTQIKEKVLVQVEHEKMRMCILVFQPDRFQILLYSFDTFKT